MQEIPKKQKIMLAALGVFIFYLFVTKVYLPTNKKIVTVKNDLKEKKQKLVQTRIKANKLGQLKAEFESINLQLKDLEKKLPRSEEIPSLIRQITDTARKYGIDVPSLNIKPPVQKKYYNEHIFRLSITAPYHNIARFFSDMGQGERIVTIRELTLQPIIKEEDKREDVKASFSLVAYTFKEK